MCFIIEQSVAHGHRYIKANSMSLKYTGKCVLQTVRQVLNDVNE